MSNKLVPANPSKEILLNHPRILEFIEAGRAQRTRKIYEEAFERFRQWATNKNRSPLPASSETMALYMIYLSDEGKKPATIDLALTSIRVIHSAANFPLLPNAQLQQLRKGLRRTKGVKQRQARPLTVELLTRGLQREATMIAIRDRALLLLGFAGALRRSEIVSLQVEDLDFKDEGLMLNIQKSKTDQEAKGRTIPIHLGSSENLCPVSALKRWLKEAKIESGLVFRNVAKGGRVGAALTTRSISRIVKRCAERAGEDASGFSGHSLRAGYATEAARRGAQSHQIMMVTGHRSDTMVRRYVREGRAFLDSVAVL